MKKLILFTLLLSLFTSCAPKLLVTSADSIGIYEIECKGAGKAGTYLINVWSISNSPQIDPAIYERNAVHGIIFRGFAAAYESPAQKPLIDSKSVEEANVAYFKQFFGQGGDYAKFIASTASTTPQVLKVGRQYKIGLIVSVAKDRLREHLEEVGVLRGLSHGF